MVCFIKYFKDNYMIIQTYNRGSLSEMVLNPETDAVISLRDPGDPMTRASGWKDVPTLHLDFSDISHLHIDKTALGKALKATTEADAEKLRRQLTPDNGFPQLPMCTYHARQIEQFIYEQVGFNRNIHIHCTYGRSRSVAVARFLSTFLYPTHELKIGREDARVNPWVWKVLNLTFGYQ
jgi:predicted protein tyrosine phosphatase